MMPITKEYQDAETMLKQLAEIIRLRDAIKKYGQHRVGCDTNGKFLLGKNGNFISPKCTCGFDKLLEEIKK